MMKIAVFKPLFVAKLEFKLCWTGQVPLVRNAKLGGDGVANEWMSFCLNRVVQSRSGI